MLPTDIIHGGWLSGGVVGHTFAELLRSYRHRSALTQDELAERSGVSVRTIRGLETANRATPRLASVRLLADALALPATELESFLAAARGVTAAPVAHCFLPYDIPDFTGRDDELNRLLAGAAPIRSIDGMPGVGKTALAVRAAHLVRGCYPDGQLFLDLRGFDLDEPPLTPEVALASLLAMIGIEDVPADRASSAGLWRAATAGKRLAVVLDNAADAQQVRPLLPGVSGSLVLITSRRRLAGLAGVPPISLDVLPTPVAAALFSLVSGIDQTDVTAEVAELCGRLPLALRNAAVRLAHRVGWPPAHLISLLRDENQRLSALDGEPGVAAAFTASYARLGPGQRRMYRSLGSFRDGEFGSTEAAALADIPQGEASDLLESLVDCHLLRSIGPDRYTCHDLVRRHARDLAEAEGLIARPPDMARRDWRRSAMSA